MLDYIPVLPGDATKWSFCLPVVYYHALTASVEGEIMIQFYDMPKPSLLPRKEDQLYSMTNSRAIAATTLKK